MASPLAAFRKYQKVLLAVFGVALMLVFTVGGLVSQYLGASPQGAMEDQVAVRWKDGQLLESELQMHRVVRRQLRQFQESVIQIAMQRGGSQDLFLNRVVPNTDAEVSIVESLLLARQAEQLGVIISDDAILQHLTKHLSDETITANELAGILESVTGDRMSPRQLFARMRIEMMAHQVRNLANGAAFDGGITDTAVSPGESFEYFKRLHRRMEAEVMPVSVVDFVDQVKESPTEAELEALFEEYKDVYPSPTSPTPGFRRRMRAAFQWLKADFQAFLDREIEKLTDQEIEEYYEANKNTYRKLNLPTAADIEGTADPTDGAASDPTDKPTSSDLDLRGEQPDGSDAATGDEADPAVSEGESSAESATGAEPSECGFQESEDEGEKDEDEQDTTAASTEAPSDVTQPDPDNPDATAGVSHDVSGTPGNESAQPGVEDADEEIEYQPIEEVRDDIAQQLARPRAIEAVNDAVLAAQAELKRYFDDHLYWDVTPEAERGPQPIPPDFAQLAARLGMVAGEIPLINVLEASDYDLGRAFEFDFSTGQFRQLPFTQMGFSPDLSLYQPRSISASDVDSKYVFWKVAEEEAKNPTLEEAREDVKRHWRMKKAIGLARDQAEKYAQKVRDRQQSLQEVFGDDENVTVTDTGEFTWMTFGSTPTGSGEPRLSSVEGTEFVGEQFMEDVSALAAGEVAVANNYPETYIYVVYVTTVSNNQEQLQEMFLNDGINIPVLYMARRDSMRTAASWYESLEESWGLEWKRPPDSGLR